MAEAIFQAPRRKRRVYESYEAPFPVPTSEEVGDGKQFKMYSAEILNNNVIVRNPIAIEDLYCKGYFGKGVLSRSRPEYSISDQILADKWKDLNAMYLPIISSAKYQHHKEWAKSLLQAQGLDKSSVRKILENYAQPVELSCLEGNKDSKGRTEMNHSTETEKEDSENKTEKEEIEKKTEKGDIENTNVPLDPTVADGDNVYPHAEDQSRSLDSKKLRLEGNALHDPLAQYGYSDADPVDKEVLGKAYCYRHDDLLIHCGCRNEELLQELSSSAAVTKSCKFSADHEYVLVQEEEEYTCDEDGDCSGKLVKTEKLVCRRNLYRIIEYLQLSLEEAFFLVYALGCLNVYYMEEPLSIAKLWDVFSVVQPSFRTRYMAYHYFRSKGWVPKVGLKYGTDLLLYRKGPPFYHASYSVVVQMVDDSYQGSSKRPFSWRSLAGLNRTTANASKELMFCYLIRPSDMTDDDMSTPDCMKRIKVQELILSRWVSSRERTEQDDI